MAGAVGEGQGGPWFLERKGQATIWWREAPGDTHADQGLGGAVVVGRGSAHGLVVVHGHSEARNGTG